MISKVHIGQLWHYLNCAQYSPVGMGRLELPILTECASETHAYTNSATCPYSAL